MTKSLFKASLIVLLIILTSGILAPRAKAQEESAELEITCNSDNEGEPCDVQPERQAPLFDPNVFPHYDLKPGDDFVRKIRVTNTGLQTCYFEIRSFSDISDTLTSTGEYFSQELLTQVSNGTDSTGELSFFDLFDSVNNPETGQPLYIGEIASAGDPSGNDSRVFDWQVRFDKSAGNEFQKAILKFDFDWTFQCGDEPESPVLNIEKTNNVLGIVQEPGDPVLYTLTITTSENPVFNVIVIDLPPEGFKYKAGTWTAMSDLRGNLKAGGITPEPVYSSPATWQLGDMQSNETVTLTYVTDISNSQQSGIYPDLAWTEGTSLEDPGSDRVLGNDITGIFVGTAAEIAVKENPEVDVEVDEEEVEEVEEVLGASSERLPETGADSVWAIIVAGIFSAGVLFIIIGLLLNKKASQTKSGIMHLIIFSLTLSVAALNVPAFAASTTIRIQEPESSTNVSPLYIGFVVLDTESRGVDVACYKKGPAEMAYSQFGSTQSLKPGGNSGFCTADTSILNAKGEYKFYATAKAASDPEVQSQTVTVYFDEEGPDKPKYIKKEKISSCEYEIEIKTANDGGETDKIVIYRDDDTEFEANSSTSIKSKNIGSDEVYSFVDTKPDCQKAYYYAVIAYDSAGNRSGVRVEEIEKVIKVTVSSEVSDSQEGGSVEVVSAGDLTGGLVSGLGDEGGSGLDVEGEGGAGEGTEPAEGSETEGQVLGETETSAFPLWLILVVFAVLATTYVFISKRKKTSS